MLGFLLKLVLVVAIGVGVVGFGYKQFSGNNQNSPGLTGLLDQARQVDIQAVTGNISYQLDKLITHTDRSPMVMGIEITNKSLEAMVDTITSLPPEEKELIRQFICEPASPSSQ